MSRFGVDEIRPAVLTVDVHRGHLDPEVATQPLPTDACTRVVAANIRLLDRARATGIPVVHVVTYYRDGAESAGNPFWRVIADTDATRSNVLRHNLDAMPGVELMPGVLGDGDHVVRTKKRYDCFLHTDLDFLLRRLDVNTLLITGVNTNSCVLTTVITASTRDYAPIVVTDCVGSVDGAEYHDPALKLIERAFGWAMDSDEALAAVTGDGT
ncbi:MAG: isochorismatase family cysteine hydrolase [Nitriliruptoraceae bacterium]